MCTVHRDVEIPNQVLQRSCVCHVQIFLFWIAILRLNSQTDDYVSVCAGCISSVNVLKFHLTSNSFGYECDRNQSHAKIVWESNLQLWLQIISSIEASWLSLAKRRRSLIIFWYWCDRATIHKSYWIQYSTILGISQTTGVKWSAHLWYSSLGDRDGTSCCNVRQEGRGYPFLSQSSWGSKPRGIPAVRWRRMSRCCFEARSSATLSSFLSYRSFMP